MRLILSVLFAAMCLGGCSRSLVTAQFQSADFSLDAVRAGRSLLVVAPNVEVMAFQKSYATLFKNSDSLAARVSRKILDSLRLDSVISANALPDTALQGALDVRGIQYVLYVRRIVIGDSLAEIPEMTLPGVGGMAPSGGGTSRKCIAVFEVEVLDAKLNRLHAFKVQTKADIALYAYKTAVLKALDAAARKTAAHLSGRSTL
jgi:hypothetical protein